MDSRLCLAIDLFIHLATQMREEPCPPMGDSFEEWLFWHTPAAEHYRSSRQGVARVEVPSTRQLFDLVLWQSLLEHPDLVIEREGVQLGVECKSLEASAGFVESRTGVPCRTTIDFNSTVPCGQERYKGKFQRYETLRGRPLRIFYALGLYGEVEDENRLLSFLLVDGNYINRDYQLHLKHRNISRGGFGSYGDGRIRQRKMYIFPNPLADQDLVGSVSLISEEKDLVTKFPQLFNIMEKIKRTPQGLEYSFYVFQLR